MTLPDQFIDAPIVLDTATERAAAATMRRTGRRLHASVADTDQVIEALFAPILSAKPTAPSQVRDGVPLTDGDKATVRRLITAGRDNASIAFQVGCSIQAVIGVRVGMRHTKKAS